MSTIAQHVPVFIRDFFLYFIETAKLQITFQTNFMSNEKYLKNFFVSIEIFLKCTVDTQRDDKRYKKKILKNF